MMKNTLYLLLAVLLFSCKEDTIEPEVFGNISGQVLLDSDSTPLANVSITTTPPTGTVLTNATGQFFIENVKTGSYTLRAELTGYTAAVDLVTVLEDKTTTTILKMKVKTESNTPPSPPTYLSPANGSLDNPRSVTLRWEATDEDEADMLLFDVFLFSSNQNPGTLVAQDVANNMLTVNDLKFGTQYFWQVAVKDGKAGPVYGEVWSFTVEPFPPYPFVFAKINNGKYDLFAAQSASPSNPLYQLTASPGSNYRPRISPDGSKIAFLSNIFPNTQLFTMKRDGSDVTLVPSPVPVDAADKFQLGFCWSPDGTKLLYMNKNHLYRINLDGSGFELFAQLPPGEEFIEVDWSGVSGKVAARTVGDLPYKSRILLYNANGTFLQEIVPDLPGNIGGPMFSVLGNAILYTHDVDGLETPDGRQLNARVFLKNLDTGDVKDLSVNKPPGTNDLNPRFSPTGALVIFTNSPNTLNAPKNIYLMNLDGAARTLLFENAEMPDWR